MAQMAFSLDIDEILPKGIKDETLAADMINAGQQVMKSAIESGASKHRHTGSMANSVRITTPKTNNNGDVIGRVLITGKDKFGMLNSYKALWAEYGTKNQPATPFVRPAIKSSESAINSAMEKVFQSKAGG